MRPRAVLGIVVLAVGLTAAGLGIWNSAWLKLETVQVTGNHHASAAEIISAANLAPGTRLNDVSNAQVAARVGTLPWVATVKITHILPSRIRIAVRERTPVAVVQAAGHNYLVDREGVILQDGGTGYPAMAALSVTLAIPGERINAPAFGPALAVLDALPAAVKARLAAVNAPSPDLISVALTDQTTITYGGADNLVDKNYALNALLASGQAYTSIDVRSPTHPAAHPR